VAFNISEELSKLTSKITSSVTDKAKDSAISTLKNPEFKATVNQFTKDWANENKYILGPVVIGFFILSVLAVVNIISNFRSRK
jgi:hypothetical protein